MTNIYLSCCMYNFDVANKDNDITQAAIIWEALSTH